MRKFLRRLLWALIFLFVLLNIITAFHAYKFTHFYDSAAIKKPEELGTWDKIKAVFFGVNFPKSKNDAYPDSPYETVHITTRDHLDLECWYIKHIADKGTVIMFHGHGSSKSKLLHEAAYMHSLGFNILLVDFRAHGGSTGQICTIGYKESEDVRAACSYIQQKDEHNIILWGISLGAATILKAVHDFNDIHPRKLVLEMPFGTLLQAVKARVRTMGLPVQPISTLLTFWGGVEHGFWAFDEKPCLYAEKVVCPVLLQWGSKDMRVSRKEIDCIYQHLSSADKKLVIYPSAAHESLYSKEPEKWRQVIRDFLSD